MKSKEFDVLFSLIQPHNNKIWKLVSVVGHAANVLFDY